MKIVNLYINSKKVTVILVLLNFIMINWVSNGLYMRFDLSKSGRFKLTNASKKILRELPENVTIEAFFSDEVPDLYLHSVKELKDFLTEYASISRGKVKLRFLNPDSDEDIKKRASALGIRPMPIGAVDQNKREVSNVYFSLALSFENQTQVIPDILRNNQVLEYNLTSRIYKMAHPEERVVGIVSGNSGFTTEESQNKFQSYSILNNSMEAFYGIMTPVSMDSQNIPDNVSVLFLVSPQMLSDKEKYHLDQYILRGGKLVVATSGVNIDFNTGSVNPKDQGTMEFFQNLGINIGSNLIIEPENFVPLRRQVNLFQVLEIPYPVWLSIPEDSLSQKSLITSGMESLFMPWASSITLDETKIKEPQVEILAKSSSKSWIKSESLSISPDALKNEIEAPAPNDAKEYQAAYMIKGKFNSFFKDKKLPVSDTNFISESVQEASLVVVSTPFMFSDSAIQQSQGLNLNFFLSALDVLNGLDELVVARNRKVSTPMMDAKPSWLKSFIILINILAPLIIFVGYGMMHFLQRKKNQSKEFNDWREMNTMEKAGN